MLLVSILQLILQLKEETIVDLQKIISETKLFLYFCTRKYRFYSLNLTIVI